MTRTVAAAMVATAIWSYHSTARGQPAIIGVQDADPPLAGSVPPAPQQCCCRFVPVDPEESELTAVIVASATAVAVSHLLATAFIVNQRGLSPIDPIPVVGTIIAAQRNSVDDRTVPLLLFSAGVQAIGILVVGMASAELAQRHRLLVEAFASPSSAGVSIGWRY
jgi:hypothetical protein